MVITDIPKLMYWTIGATLTCIMQCYFSVRNWLLYGSITKEIILDELEKTKCNWVAFKLYFKHGKYGFNISLRWLAKDITQLPS